MMLPTTERFKSGILFASVVYNIKHANNIMSFLDFDDRKRRPPFLNKQSLTVVWSSQDGKE
jgi:hypothetical protein